MNIPEPQQQIDQFRIYCHRLSGINQRFEEVRKRHTAEFGQLRVGLEWAIAAMVGFTWAVGAIPDFFTAEPSP